MTRSKRRSVIGDTTGFTIGSDHTLMWLSAAATGSSPPCKAENILTATGLSMVRSICSDYSKEKTQPDNAMPGCHTRSYCNAAACLALWGHTVQLPAWFLSHDIAWAASLANDHDLVWPSKGLLYSPACNHAQQTHNTGQHSSLTAQPSPLLG